MKRDRLKFALLGLATVMAVSSYFMSTVGRDNTADQVAGTSPTTSQPQTSQKNGHSGSLEDTRRLPTMMLASAFYQAKGSSLVSFGNYECKVYHGVTNISSADMVLFGDREVLHYKKPPLKKPKQLSALFLKEPQAFLGGTRLSPWDGFFNYSATFLRNNEGSFHIFRARLKEVHPKGTMFFSSELRNQPIRALWFVSHCTTPSSNHKINSAREEYVLELSKYIQVDIFTSKNRHLCPQRFNKLLNIQFNTEEPDMARYMFYLAFENNLCKDYISEKLWKVLESNGSTIPIALGGLSIDDYKAVAPPNSFIHVRNFTSPQALAEHLKYVSQDDNAFHYYHQWRNEYRLVTKHVGNDIGHSYDGDFMEYFCELLHKRPANVIDNLSQEFTIRDCVKAASPDVHCPYYNLTCNSTSIGVKYT